MLIDSKMAPSTKKGSKQPLQQLENPPAAKPISSGSKRSLEDTDNQVNDSFQAYLDVEEEVELKWSCNQVRNKINTYLRSGEMKVGEFQNTLNVSSNAYQRFMKAHGTTAGAYSDTYAKAHMFFQWREDKGLKMPKAKKPKMTDTAKFDVSDITLPGQDEDAVPVYDTCDDIRKKINAHLRTSKMTQTHFCREISKSFSDKTYVTTEQLKRFLSKKGPWEGNTSNAFYGSYVYFEKLRIKRNGEKTEKRKEMEEIHPRGMDTSSLHNRVWVQNGSHPYVDDYGKLHVY